MNAVEIEEAISELALEAFDKDEFPFAFLRAFGNKETTIKRLRAGTTNKSDLGGVLQTNNIHIAVTGTGEVTQKLGELRESPATARAKARFILSTDGVYFEAEDLETGETVACEYEQFPDHFGFFLPLAGISTVKQLRDSSFDIRATSRLNRLYVELLKDNPDWGGSEQRHEMNHFMARLIFCFFAEDTDIFAGESLFTDTVEQMSARDSSNTHEVISQVFRSMNTRAADRQAEKLPRWTERFPYVNGGLFSGSIRVPKFSKIARSYLLHIGNLDWTQINPDIFGSMIQAVADDEERGSLGMHYTSVPNILKVLNPLFLDDLREKLEEAGDNPRKLLNLRNRMARIRVFDPACGSGNFLVIAYKQMREIENKINELRGEPGRKSDIPLTNFRGIELRDFSAEIARLALIIAEYQCDVLYRGQKEALQEFLPLNADNWITCGNALRIDWLSVCPFTGLDAPAYSDDCLESKASESYVDFENEGGETYICGNPPYVGATIKPPKGATKEVRERLKKEDESRKADLHAIFEGRAKTWKSLDYVSAWFMKAADYGSKTNSSAAFVSTNSICQGQQAPVLWPMIFATGHRINFAHTSFNWKNLAANNAGVTVVIVGISKGAKKRPRIYSIDKFGNSEIKEVDNINPYLVPAQNVIVDKSRSPLSPLQPMTKGSAPTDGGYLLLDKDEVDLLDIDDVQRKRVVRRFLGSDDSINGRARFCLWMTDADLNLLSSSESISERLRAVKSMRLGSSKKSTQELARKPYRFGEVRQNGNELPIVVPRHSSESREYLPFAVGKRGDIVADSASAIFDGPLWNAAVLASRLHLVWVATVCGKIKTDYRYSNTLGWNTFPLPVLTEKNKADLTICAENILIARESHFPSTIAELYDPEKMPANLADAHEQNDEVLERIFIGRRFKNDTERLEKLFELYTKMTSKQPGQAKSVKPKQGRNQ
ncbi:lactate dehydrogenase [Marinobacter sp. CP1]|uniref:class I SAM-dependent DNA methyltransferase n=1 Tax=unclassified Marinobacter TaxID=83889 RepID=UPI00069EB438|nr:MULTISPECIES: DNA methyltransferase [unclassified Marinobacter]AKV97618.1 lactate dehydrogenase [Marinobacter sp. CP1]